MTSTIWTRALDVLGVSQYAEFPEIEFPEIESAYRTRLHSFNFEFARGPNSKAQTDEDFWKIKQAHHLIFNLNKVKQSLEALTDDEYQRYLDGFDAMQFKDIAPTWGELREQTQFLHQLLESNNTLLSLKRLISYNTAQSRWILGLNSCLTLHSDLISTILGAKEGRPSHKTHPGHENTQDELNAALRGGTSEEDSQQVNIELPLILAGQHIMTTPDTGSDSNVISATMAKQLGLHLKRCSSHDAFKLANGCVIACKGQVSTQFSFPSEETSPLSIEFHVLEPLATSIIVGRIFLDATKTLTAHLDRLIRSPHPCEVALCPPRILHLNPPRRTLQCFINSIQVEANADTGAEMNLASPEFAARSGFSIEPTDQQHQFVQLADGSIASISGCFRARFNPSEKPSTETLRPRAHMKTFYILDGLTSDILLSRHLIFEIYAFVEQANAFSEMERPDLYAELNLIAWLNRWRSKSGSRPIQHTSISEKYFAFWSEIDVDDAREQRLHQQRKLEASRIQIQADREAAEDAESQRHGHYNQRRQRRIQTHNAEMALLGRNG